MLCKFVCQAGLAHFYTAPRARVLYNPQARLNDSTNLIHFGRMRTPPSCFMNWGKPADGERGGASTSSRSGQRLPAACRLQRGGGEGLSARGGDGGAAGWSDAPLKLSRLYKRGRRRDAGKWKQPPVWAAPLPGCHGNIASVFLFMSFSSV